ncbi:MAG: hypothetical protein Q8865_03010 [Bacillota bacterium]|nr:hypothetical protein [Bacillota bacterium]
MKYKNKWAKRPRLVRLIAIIVILLVAVTAFGIITYNLLSADEFVRVQTAKETDIDSEVKEEQMDMLPVNRLENINNNITGKIELKGIVQISNGTSAAVLDTSYGVISISVGETVGQISLESASEGTAVFTIGGKNVQLTLDNPAYTIPAQKQEADDEK